MGVDLPGDVLEPLDRPALTGTQQLLDDLHHGETLHAVTTSGPRHFRGPRLVGGRHTPIFGSLPSGPCVIVDAMADGMPPAPHPPCPPSPNSPMEVVRLRAAPVGDAPRIVEQCFDPESIRWTTVPLGYDEAMVAIGRDEPPGLGRRRGQPAVGDRSGRRRRHRARPRVPGDDRRPPRGVALARSAGLHPGGRGRHLMTALLRLATQWWFDQAVRRFWDANANNRLVARARAFGLHLPGASSIRSGPSRDRVVDARRASVGRDDDLTRPVKAVARKQVVPRARGPAGPWRDDDVDALEPGATRPATSCLPGAGAVIAETATPGGSGGLNRARQRATNWHRRQRHGSSPGDVCPIEDGQEEGTVELGYFLLELCFGVGRGDRGGTPSALTYAFTPVEAGGPECAGDVPTAGDNDASSVLYAWASASSRSRPSAPGGTALDDARHWRCAPTQLLRDAENGFANGYFWRGRISASRQKLGRGRATWAIRSSHRRRARRDQARPPRPGSQV